MTETTPFNALEYLDSIEVCHAYIRVMDDEFNKLAVRYDEAMQRINDMQAELEFLRLEVNRE